MSESDPHRQLAPAGGERGFTLIELMIVVLILGLVAQAVVANYAAMLPEYGLDSEARVFANYVEAARTEAQIRAEPIQIEIDFTTQEYRMLLPPELRLTSDQPETQQEALDWVPLDEAVRFDSWAAVGGPVVQNNRVKISIDHNGFMADQVVVMTPRAEDMRDLVWSIQFRGLERGSEILRDREGTPQWLTAMNEGAFQ